MIPFSKNEDLQNRLLNEWILQYLNKKIEYKKNMFAYIFQKNSAIATLGLKEMGKFLWESRKKGLPCWLSRSHSKVHWENAKKSLVLWKMGLY